MCLSNLWQAKKELDKATDADDDGAESLTGLLEEAMDACAAEEEEEEQEEDDMELDDLVEAAMRHPNFGEYNDFIKNEAGVTQTDFGFRIPSSF